MIILEDYLEKLKKGKEYNKLRKELKKRIISGETSGDQIDDFLIVCYGILPQEFEEEEKKLYGGGNLIRVKPKLQELQEKISQNQNQQILIWTNNITIGKYSKEEFFITSEGAVPFPLNSHKSLLVLGILNGQLTLDLEKQGILLPTESFAIRDETDSNKLWKHWTKQEGPVYISAHSLLYFDFDVPLTLPLIRSGTIFSYPAHQESLRTLIGDKNVQAFFRHKVCLLNSGKLIEIIKKDTNQKGIGYGKQDIFYAEALELLGLDQKELKEKYKGLIHQKKLDVLTNIEDCLSELSKVEKKIQKIYANIGTFPIEDKTTAFFITWGDEDRKTDLKARIKRELKNAKELELNKEEQPYTIGIPGRHIHPKEYLSEIEKLVSEEK